MPAYMKSVKAMEDVEYMEEKKARVSLAVGKWLEILSINWAASTVGEQVASDLWRDPSLSGDEAELTLRSVFGVKSPTTLLKRAASMRQYFDGFKNNTEESHRGAAPIPFYEPDVWRYFFFLRNKRTENNRGFTISSTFLESAILQVCLWHGWQ